MQDIKHRNSRGSETVGQATADSRLRGWFGWAHGPRIKPGGNRSNRGNRGNIRPHVTPKTPPVLEGRGNGIGVAGEGIRDLDTH